jgi:hypothetical protein
MNFDEVVGEIIYGDERNPSYFSSNIHSGWSNGRGLRNNGMGWNAIGREDIETKWRKGANNGMPRPIASSGARR